MEWLLLLLLLVASTNDADVVVSDAGEFVEEIFDAELNEIYDTLIDVLPRPVPGTQVMMNSVFIEFMLYVKFVLCVVLSMQ